MTKRWVALTSILIAGCATSSGPPAGGQATRELSRHAVRYDGPEIVAVVSFARAARTLGEEWLILAVEFMGSSRGGPTSIDRAGISVYTPDGRRLPIVSQEEYRREYPKLRIGVERAVAYLPILARYDRSEWPCDRWFLVDPFAGFAYDYVAVNPFQVCSGPMVFRVPGGVQPGRWRLIIELQESRADIPFELEAEN